MYFMLYVYLLFDGKTTSFERLQEILKFLRPQNMMFMFVIIIIIIIAVVAVIAIIIIIEEFYIYLESFCFVL